MDDATSTLMQAADSYQQPVGFFVSAEEYRTRINACIGCEHRIETQCRLQKFCGFGGPCLFHVHLAAVHRGARCTAERWPENPPPPEVPNS